MLHKLNKVDYTKVMFFQVISLLNFQGKICEKVVNHILAD